MNYIRVILLMEEEKNPTYYENVVEPIVSKEKWESCQTQDASINF